MPDRQFKAGLSHSRPAAWVTASITIGHSTGSGAYGQQRQFVVGADHGLWLARDQAVKAIQSGWFQPQRIITFSAATPLFERIKELTVTL